MNKYLRLITDPLYRFSTFNVRGFYKKMPDDRFLKKLYRLKFQKELDLDNPKTFNEKLQWLKLYDRKPEYTKMVDKYEVKKLVAEKLGEEYVIPTLGVYDSFDEIDFDKLPDQFVLKCTHNSGGHVICRNKSSLNIPKAKKRISTALKQDYFLFGREWPYKNVPKKIIAEKYLIEKSELGEECLTDYKWFCFNGEPKLMYISKDNASEPTTDFFDMDFNHIEMRMKDPNSKTLPLKPSFFEKMKELAALLSQGIPQLRVDFYFVDGQIYVGELTFFHNSGFSKIKPESWDLKLGEWITLPRIEK